MLAAAAVCDRESSCVRNLSLSTQAYTWRHIAVCALQETYIYAKTLLSCATSNADGRGRALLVGGGIANFTDVAATFKGIIRAMQEYAEAIKTANLRIYVRRGGPNYEAGLDLMRTLGANSGLHIEVFGPATSMTGICELAIDWVNLGK